LPWGTKRSQLRWLDQDLDPFGAVTAHEMGQMSTILV